LRNFDGLFDISILSAFVAATEQHGDDRSALLVVHSIARAIIDPHLADASADWLHIARITVGQPVNPRENPCARLRVPQAGQPAIERRGFLDL
jgi:hypothetical protein